MNIQLDKLPEELKSKGKFCLVKEEDKAPQGVYKKYDIGTNDAYLQDYTDFNTALNNVNGKFYTVGVLAYNGICFIDLDDCVDILGNLTPTAQKIVDYFNSYTEYSTSSAGVHIYFKCAEFLSPFTKETYKEKYGERTPYKEIKSVECYLSDDKERYCERYGIVTGNHVEGTPEIIKDVSDKIEKFLDKVLLKSEKTDVPVPAPYNHSTNSADEIINHLMSMNDNFKFYDLFEKGNITNFPSASEADIALATKIAFRVGNNPELIKEIMFRSALVRDKWIKHKTYLDTTIKNAIAGCNGNFYDPNYYKEKADNTLSTVKTQKKEDKQEKRLNYKTGADAEIKSTEWLWYPYIPRGAVTMLGSPPGVGKTFLATWICAQVSNNLNFPVFREFSTYGNNKVVYLSSEDDYHRTIIPRYKANGGIVENFIWLEEDDGPASFADKRLELIIKQIKPDLIVFDALSSYFGVNGNVNNFSDVRKALKPLKKLVEDTSTAILIITHFNKMSSETNALNRISGSVDFGAFIRSGLTVGKNPSDKDQLVMAQSKNNLAPIGDSIGFHITDTADINKMPSLMYDGIVMYSADELLGKPRTQAPVVAQAEEQLLELLEKNGNKIKAKEAMEILTNQGISSTSVQRAKNNLGCSIKKERENGKNVSYWYLEDDSNFSSNE